ncbi:MULTISPECIES: hypothetical protein [unclassified Flavobacterium]|uniref:hypothetical protein n=1 Tax=unclassified Flavobacterium TaxID=196869 RepID=UPI0009666115|nr:MULTISPECIES: hypothetical protein [unclassified Flavobacterium]MBN9285565.1 hypothetical protein [Flavobacterium sp.]OJV71077.1 MAG: hypothetical protein BGO42_04480 [Flavobacterium sp. 40-81]
MISEKTVELNLTTEFVNLAFHQTGIRPFILAPSQRAEATLAYDVQYGFPGFKGILIQYKRAHVKNTNEYIFNLNRTSKQDQHLRLFVLDLMGFPVYYAFPIFHLETEVIYLRRNLLLHTKFVRPSRIFPVGGLTGHHEVVYYKSTNTWKVFSEEGTPFEGVEDLNDLLERFKDIPNSLEELMSACNFLFSNEQTVTQSGYKIESSEKDDYNLMRSQSIIGG